MAVNCDFYICLLFCSPFSNQRSPLNQRQLTIFAYTILNHYLPNNFITHQEIHLHFFHRTVKSHLHCYEKLTQSTIIIINPSTQLLILNFYQPQSNKSYKSSTKDCIINRNANCFSLSFSIHFYSLNCNCK